MPDPTPLGQPEEIRVAEVLQKVRSGVRLRRAEAATLSPRAAEAHSSLLELRQREYVREPVPFSHRPGLGKLIVLSRKAFYKLFLKWFARPVLEQQNAFNQTAARLIEDLVAAQERTARELRQVSARLQTLEQRLGEEAPPGGSGG
jgi:hypothetical protein